MPPLCKIRNPASIQKISKARRSVKRNYPNYIYGGVAIHGNPSVPAFPASHGCIRIPMFASREFSQIATIGMVVIVYDSNTLAQG